MEQEEGSRERGEAGLDPQWLRLKWGVAVVSRAFDVWSAFTHGLPREDVVRYSLNLMIHYFSCWVTVPSATQETYAP